MAEEGEGQVFNMALAFLQHLYSHIVQASDYAMSGDYLQWFKILQSLHRKIIPFIKEEEHKKLLELENQIDWTSYNYFKNRNAKEFLAASEEIYPKLCEIEIELFVLLKKYDLLMPKATDPRFLFGKIV